MLAQFFQDQSFRKPRRVNCVDLDLLEQKRNSADMILMTMRDHKKLSLFVHPDQMMIIGNDIVYAEQLVSGKQNAAVYDADFVFVLIAVHVFSDFSQTAKRIDERIALLDLVFIVSRFPVCRMPLMLI